MKLILIIAVALIAISLVATFLWPLLLVLFGFALVYYAYKNITRANRGVLEVIFWIAIAAVGVAVIVNALPGLTFIIAILVAAYFITKILGSKNNQKPAVNKNGSIEAQWREL